MAAGSEVIATALIDIRASNANLKRDLDGAVRKTQTASKKMIAAFNAVKLQIGIAVTAFGFLGKSVLKSASDVEEMRDKFKAVFKSTAADVEAWATTHAKSIGRSRFEMMGYLSTMQDTFVPMGIARKKAAELSKQVVQLAEDVASFNNTATTDTVRDFQSALVGNTETVRKYGIVLTQAALDAELLRQGFKGGAKKASEQQKLLARLNIIIKNTSDAHGNAAETAGSFANRLKAANAAILDLKVSIGTKFIPVAGDMIASFTSLPPVIQATTIAIGLLTVAMATLGGVATGIIVALGAVTTAMAYIHTAFVDANDPTSELSKYLTGLKAEFYGLGSASKSATDDIKGFVSANSDPKLFEILKRRKSGESLESIKKDPRLREAVEEKLKTEQPLQEGAEEAASILSEEIRDSFASAGQALREGDFESIFNNIITNVFDRTVENMLNTFADAMAGSAGKSGGGGLGGFISGAIGFIFGGGKGDAAGAKTPAPAPKADGGRFMGGSTHLVGERGPELAHFSGGGSIIPNDELGGGSRQTINITNNNDFNVGDTVSKNQLGAAMNNLRSQIPKDIAKISRDGGRNGSLIRGE